MEEEARITVVSSDAEMVVPTVALSRLEIGFRGVSQNQNMLKSSVLDALNASTDDARDQLVEMNPGVVENSTC